MVGAISDTDGAWHLHMAYATVKLVDRRRKNLDDRFN